MMVTLLMQRKVLEAAKRIKATLKDLDMRLTTGSDFEGNVMLISNYPDNVDRQVELDLSKYLEERGL